MTEEYPLVSVVTPTYGHRNLFELAVHNFLNLDYPNLEWIIIDEGPEPVKDLVPDQERIKYYYFSEDDVKALYTKFRERLSKQEGKSKEKLLKIHSNWFHKGKIPIGMKRNLCAFYASGDIIVHMDDDDYYPSESVSTRVDAILKGEKKDCSACSVLNHYYPKGDISFKSKDENKSLEKQIISSTLAYTKRFWTKRNFNNQDISDEVYRFIKGRLGAVQIIEPDDVIVAILHSKNFVNYKAIRNAEPNGWHFKKLEENLHKYISNID